MYNKAWYEANKAKAYAATQAWSKRNPEKVKAYGRRWKSQKHAYMRAVLNRYKRWLGCKDCGEKDPVVLQFDHARGTKTDGVGRLMNRPRAILKAELAKCDVRCANCHVRVTFARGQY